MASKAKEVFKGKVVKKKFSRVEGFKEFPRYVLEYLIDQYCTEENIQQGIKKVEKVIREHYAEGSDKNALKHAIRKQGHYTLLAPVEVRFESKDDHYWATIPPLDENFVRINPRLLDHYENLLRGGMWGTVELDYDPTYKHKGNIRPYYISDFTPFQVSKCDLGEYINKRKEFTTEEWIELLINSIGLDPSKLTARQRLVIISRLVPIVESNTNFIELGPRETGKTYLYRHISYRSILISGGKATPASLFINLNTRQIGVIGIKDAVVFDEIAHTHFADPETTVSIFKDYMQSGRFNRGGREYGSTASVVMAGNIDVQQDKPHPKYAFLLEVLPDELKDIALLDRVHGFIPGWEIPKLKPQNYAKDYGFISDYFCEILHQLRRFNFASDYKKYFELKNNLTDREVTAVEKIASGMLKLLFPDGRYTVDELQMCLDLACEYRQRIRDQLTSMAPGEYPEKGIGYIVRETGQEIIPSPPSVKMPKPIAVNVKPKVGEVIGLTLNDFGQGFTTVIEAKAIKGKGRLIRTGNMHKVMKESVQTAYDFVRYNREKLGIEVDIDKDFDIHVQATECGIPKEGPALGITFLVAIASALLDEPVKPNLAMTGEMTLLGKVLPVGGIFGKLAAAQMAGAKTVIIPAASKGDVALLPKDLKGALEIIYVSEVGEVLTHALGED